MQQKKETGFRKYDQGKLRYDLMPAKVLEQVVDVLTYGANKYTTKDSDGITRCKHIIITYTPAIKLYI